MAALMLPKAVLTHLKAGVRAAAAPEPVLITVCLHLASVTAPKQARPSLTTSLAGAKCRLAKPDTARLAKPGTRCSFNRTGFSAPPGSPSGTKGVVAQPPRLAVHGGLASGNEGCLARSTAAALAAAGALPAEVGVVDLDAPAKPLLGVTFQHDLRQLVLDLPGGGLGDAETAAEFDAGDALLALGQVIHGAKPQPQRQMG